MPQTAAKLGLNYTTVTIGAEPAQTTQLFTTMIAMSYIEKDINKLLDAGYAALDPDSKVRTIINDIKKWHSEYPDDWRKTRQLLREKYTQDNGSRRDNNGYELITGASIAAMLYGNGDFIQTIQTGFNYGWDCDNVTATMGTIIGTQMGYKEMMSQGWIIVDRYKNTTRDGMPLNETITSFADRIFSNMEQMIIEKGGKRIKRDGKYYFLIPKEDPANVQELPALNDQIISLAKVFKPEIESGINNPSSKEDQARAVYLAVCLDMAYDMASEHPGRWKEAVKVFDECWKMKQILFHDDMGNFPSIKRLQRKFISAGINAQEKEIDLVIVWQEKKNFLPEEEALMLNIDN